jgi:hypothetical protein
MAGRQNLEDVAAAGAAGGDAGADGIGPGDLSLEPDAVDGTLIPREDEPCGSVDDPRDMADCLCRRVARRRRIRMQ